MPTLVVVNVFARAFWRWNRVSRFKFDDFAEFRTVPRVRGENHVFGVRCAVELDVRLQLQL